MTERDRKRLKEIHTFPALVKYLRDDLGWPVEQDKFDDVDDITFDWEADELGIDPDQAAKIEYIKQLRPLENGQPQGVFFVKFDTKSLPVVALRRLLGKLVIKKRATAAAAERPLWAMRDLVFISSYGESAERQLSFAYFQEPEHKSELPSLKVLGWDDRDTPLHLDRVHEKLALHLTWPESVKALPTWRKGWSAAFELKHGEVVTTAKQLAEQLAALARGIRERANQLLKLETENGPLRTLMEGFKKALIHDLTEDQFADMYAQTIAYGLLSARITHPDPVQAETLPDLIPVTNPFLKELMETFVLAGGKHRGRKKGHHLDFDELGINDVVELLRRANMDAVLRDFGADDRKEDPVLYFYEGFAKAYDPVERMRRGEFYTPKPVVSYIVRSVHEILQSEFGIEDGLASTITWSEMAKRHKGLIIPKGVAPASPFLLILDPATGTGTFLIEVIEVVRATLKARWTKEGLTEARQIEAWNDYVPNHLLPRLHGFELKMAPYAIAHLKLGLKLFESGYEFGSDERARIYLTNALEPASDTSHSQIDALSEALAHESEAVGKIKKSCRFTVVIGNPPYSYMSANLNESSRALVAPFRSVDGKRIVERGALVFERALQDDYIKFFALTFQMLDASGVGIVGMISNSAYLNSPHHRGMRSYIREHFNHYRAIDLHGDIKSGADDDENVFEIRTGVAIGVAERLPERGDFMCAIADLSGPRSYKEQALRASTLASDCRAFFSPEPGQCLFNPTTGSPGDYGGWVPVAEIFPLTSVGIKTNRDNLVIGFDDQEIDSRICTLIDLRRSTEAVKAQLSIADNAQWKVADGRKECKAEYSHSNFKDLDYRPFDRRRIYYHPSVVFNPRPAVMSQLVTAGNVALLTNRQIRTDTHAHFFVSDRLCMAEFLSSADNCNVYPLWIAQDGLLRGAGRRPNLSASFLKSLSVALELPQQNPHGVPSGLTPEDIFYYVYAVAHSPGYRSRYASFLKIDFPRIPLTESLDLFRELMRVGFKLVSLHLMGAHNLADSITIYTGPKSPAVGRVGWSNNTVWLDAAATKKGQHATAGTIGFHGVPEAVWNFHIGGYQVCEKWLKDRKGRKLLKADIEHYQKIVVALSETIRIMKEVDEVIEHHGGWPGAFRTGSTDVQ